MERKKKLRIIQLSLLVMGTIIIFFTYLTQEVRISESLIPKETQEKIKNQTSSGNEDGDVFYNIEYSGLDLLEIDIFLNQKRHLITKINKK